MRFLFLEPFFGGSHKDFAEGVAAHSRHEIRLLTLPARFWKWRMRGAALWFIGQIDSLSAYDGLIVTGLMSLSDFRAAAGGSCPPALLYLHENQLAYPLAPGERLDMQFGFTDITTALAAHRIVFNSSRHRDTFLTTLPAFIRRMPEYLPLWVVDAIRAKATVCHPGCGFSGADAAADLPGNPVPVIVWNHRWEHDKAPDLFFDALHQVREMGLAFQLVVLGERYRRVPPIFPEAQQRFRAEIQQWGYASGKSDYLAWLRRGDIVISTAHQENFGIAVVEAMRCGCLPLLPNRLSYPEILPPAFHEACLYQDQSDLVRKLARCLRQPARYRPLRRELSQAMARYAWRRRIGAFDALLEGLTEGDLSSPPGHRR